MKILKQFRNLIRENERSMKSPQKHDANLQKNSTLYFQVGLIVCLLAAYGVLEMKFLNEPFKPSNETAWVDPDDGVFYDIPTIIIEEPSQKESPVENVEVRPIIDIIQTTTNPIIDEPTVVTPESAPYVPEGEITVVEPIDPDNIPFIAVEEKPIFPGCENEKTNEAKMACFQSKISNFVEKKFNTNIASEYGLSGIQKVYVQFKIDKNGEIVDIKSRAPHPALEKEAERVIDKLPKMTPGKQRDTPVSVIYSLPIAFQVR